jgi:hypothetical protein
MNDAVIMMTAVSGGFALLAVLGALWWFVTGQWRTRAEGAAIVLDDDDVPVARTPPATAG